MMTKQDQLFYFRIEILRLLSNPTETVSISLLLLGSNNCSWNNQESKSDERERQRQGEKIHQINFIVDQLGSILWTF